MTRGIKHPTGHVDAPALGGDRHVQRGPHRPESGFERVATVEHREQRGAQELLQRRRAAQPVSEVTDMADTVFRVEDAWLDHIPAKGLVAGQQESPVEPVTAWIASGGR